MRGRISIAQATAAELSSVVRLLRELTDEIAGFPLASSEQVAENAAALLHERNHYMLVAKVGGAAVGLINFSTRRTALHPAPVGLIDELIVAKEMRHLGLGTKLVAAAIDRCRALGCCELEVGTERTNEAAKAFYRKCGFEEDAALLELPLSR